MTEQIVDRPEAHVDDGLIPWTDEDRTRSELVQIWCLKCGGVTPHTRTYVYSAFAWPEPGVDTCNLCGRSP